MGERGEGVHQGVELDEGVEGLGGHQEAVLMAVQQEVWACRDVSRAPLLCS